MNKMREEEGTIKAQGLNKIHPRGAEFRSATHTSLRASFLCSFSANCWVSVIEHHLDILGSEDDAAVIAVRLITEGRLRNTISRWKKQVLHGIEAYVEGQAKKEPAFAKLSNQKEISHWLRDNFNLHMFVSLFGFSHGSIVANDCHEQCERWCRGTYAVDCSDFY